LRLGVWRVSAAYFSGAVLSTMFHRVAWKLARSEGGMAVNLARGGNQRLTLQAACLAHRFALDEAESS
jgi:hypothetical protein